MEQTLQLYNLVFFKYFAFSLNLFSSSFSTQRPSYKKIMSCMYVMPLSLWHSLPFGPQTKLHLKYDISEVQPSEDTASPDLLNVFFSLLNLTASQDTD